MESLKGQGAPQNKYEEEIELTEVFTEAFCKEYIDTNIQYAKDDKAYEFRAFKKEN